MNFNWPGKTGKDILPLNVTVADGRLKSVKRALKTFRKSVEDSLRTANSRNKNEDLDARKRRCNEFVLGETLSTIVPVLTEDKNASPLGTIVERYANFEMTIGHMLAANEMEIATFLSSDTPFVKLLDKELPIVQSLKKDLEQLTKRLQSAQASLVKETAKLEKLLKQEDNFSNEERQQQMKKKDELSHDVDVLCKDLALEQDKLTSTLLTLVSRENRYASSFLEMMRIKKHFYENAYNLINAELPYIERILSETKQRPVFGEHLEDHLKATGKCIAYPILLSVKYLRLNGQNDEGLFRISSKQIKLDKVKAYIDANKPIDELLKDCDSHLYSSLLKSYLRELPEPLLGRQSSAVYKRWIDVGSTHELDLRITKVREILIGCLPPEVYFNIQYLVKFLHELSKNCQATKMTPYNLAIVMGPTLLWSKNCNSVSEQSNIETVIGIVSFLIENYHEIFTEDNSWDYFEDESKPLESPVNLRNNNNELDQYQTRPTSTPPASESPSHKRSNIFKSSIFKSKTNTSLSSRPTPDDLNGSPPVSTGTPL